MHYPSTRPTGVRSNPIVTTGLIVVVLFVVFVLMVFWFRKPKEIQEDRIGSIAEIMTPDPINEAVLAGAIDLEAKEAAIHPMGSPQSIGRAIRGEKDEFYFFEIETELPEIDREEFYYEVWLVRPIPYDFLPLGEMLTNEEGRFVLEWQAPDKDADYSAHVELVITRQEYKGSPDPNVKIAEGQFGK